MCLTLCPDVFSMTDDGYAIADPSEVPAGLEGAAPFQAIIVAAAAPQVPEQLRQQLAPGGRMVLPLAVGRNQRLVLVERSGRGFVEAELDAVRFVPMEMGKA